MDRVPSLDLILNFNKWLPGINSILQICVSSRSRRYHLICICLWGGQFIDAYVVVMLLQPPAKQYTSGSITRSGVQSPYALLTRVCGTLVAMVPRPCPRIRFPEWISCQRIDMDHSFTPECPNSRMRSYVSKHFPSHRECYRRVCAMASWRSTGSTSSRRSGMVSAHRDWVSWRCGGRRGLADWLLSLKMCYLICLGSQRPIRRVRTLYSFE